MTREQVKKFNEKCKNGYRLDIETFIFHKEKTCVLNVDIEGSSDFYAAFLDFNEKIKGFDRLGYTPRLRIARYNATSTDGLYSVSTLYEEELEGFTKRRTAKILQDLTADYPAEKILQIVENIGDKKVQKDLGGIILE